MKIQQKISLSLPQVLSRAWLFQLSQAAFLLVIKKAVCHAGSHFLHFRTNNFDFMDVWNGVDQEEWCAKAVDSHPQLQAGEPKLSSISYLRLKPQDIAEA